VLIPQCTKVTVKIVCVNFWRMTATLLTRGDLRALIGRVMFACLYVFPHTGIKLHYTGYWLTQNGQNIHRGPLKIGHYIVDDNFLKC